MDIVQDQNRGGNVLFIAVAAVIIVDKIRRENER